MKTFTLVGCLLLLLCTETFAQGWRTLVNGLDYGEFALTSDSENKKNTIFVVRLDPELWELVLIDGKKEKVSNNRSVKAWCRANRLVGCVNAGMYGADYATHIGHMRSVAGINNDNINRYQSIAAFGANRADQAPPFHIFDLDAGDTTLAEIFKDYNNVLQNLRLIKRSRENRWGPQEKVWSEAALGEDSKGNVLLLFCPMPLSMHDFIEHALALPIDLVAAQHLEGGQEAQFFLEVDDFYLELSGTFVATAPAKKDSELGWPVPNVLGFRPRVAKQ
jgi:hypothetical protein